MSGLTPAEGVAGQPLSRAVISEMLETNFGKLPATDQKLFRLGPVYVGAVAGLSGLIFNRLYSGALHVTQARFTAALPMAALPFLTTTALYTAAVSGPLLGGELQCPSCAATRGALVAVFGGGVYPALLAVTMNIGLACRYNTTPIPERGNIVRFCVELSRPLARRAGAVLALQAALGAATASKHFDIYCRLARFAFGPGGEELGD